MLGLGAGPDVMLEHDQPAVLTAVRGHVEPQVIRLGELGARGRRPAGDLGANRVPARGELVLDPYPDGELLASAKPIAVSTEANRRRSKDLGTVGVGDPQQQAGVVKDFVGIEGQVESQRLAGLRHARPRSMGVEKTQRNDARRSAPLDRHRLRRDGRGRRRRLNLCRSLRGWRGGGGAGVTGPRPE